MATIDTAEQARTALEVARTELLADVASKGGASWAMLPESQKLSAVAHIAIDDTLAAAYLAALDAALP